MLSDPCARLKPLGSSRAALRTRAMTSVSGSKRTGSNKRPAQELDRTTVSGPSYQEDKPEVTPVPLKYVVQEAVKRWFEDTMQEAQRGSVKEMALLGQMYQEGYGVQRDPRAAKEWIDKASARGYRMQGVYCEL
ncbi:hypothetical protein V8C86DRAFT_2518222 [Haematococcus lacustris]